MNRIDQKFKELKAKKKKALIVYLTAGDPSLRKTEELILAFEKAGVDIVEIGVPFSDPLADGPVIQEASNRSLAKKTNLRQILAMVQRLRRKTNVPLLFMTYLNPVLHYGLPAFAHKAAAAGLDGVIIPELPPDEGAEISRVLKNANLHLVYLLAPTSSQARRDLVTHQSKGFVYYVSITGVTGARGVLPADVARNIRLAKSRTGLPVCVGFGISNPAQARLMSKLSDGVIIGSAVVKAISAHPKMPAAQFARKFIRPFSHALNGRD